jgi:MFS transporter, OFA family, oxalate/formate antiporter
MKLQHYMNTPIKKAALVIMFFVMFILGAINYSKGVILPRAQEDLGLNYSDIGIIMSIYYTGFFLSSLFGGYITDKRGLRFILAGGTLIMVLGLAGTGFSSNFVTFAIFYAIVGAGLGTMTISSNAVVPLVFPKKQGLMFNIMMGVYGIGAFLAPLLLDYLFGIQVTWRTIYVAIGIVLIVFALYSMKAPMAKKSTKESLDVKQFFGMLKNKQFLLIMLMLTSYVAAEAGFASWLPGYLEGIQLENAQSKGAQILSLFFAIFTIGRLLGGIIVDKFGEKSVILVFSILAAVCLSIAKFGPDSFAILYGISGAFFSVIFPTAVALATSLFKNAGSALGFLYTAAGIGAMVSTWLVGYVMEFFGVRAGFNLPILFIAGVTVCALFIKDKKKASNKSNNEDNYQQMAQ